MSLDWSFFSSPARRRRRRLRWTGAALAAVLAGAATVWLAGLGWGVDESRTESRLESWRRLLILPGRSADPGGPRPSGPRRLVGRLDPPPKQGLEKAELAAIIGSRNLSPTEARLFSAEGPDGQPLFVRTTLDPELQALACRLVEDSKALKTALVVLDPRDGRVLALAGASAGQADGNAALEGSFPAASLFKIVTAAAAVEKADFTADSAVSYDGGKHTLFKGNVFKEPNQGRHQATLRESFAESINVVFGKLGTFAVTPEELVDLAERFRFNEDIDFEMPVAASTFELGLAGSEEDSADHEGLGTPAEQEAFHLAELASGFNRVTRVSPVHGALMASAVAMDGELFEPTIVSEVFDRDNNVLYRSRPQSLGQIVAPETAHELAALMRAAVSEGTGRKRFADAAVHPLLSRLELGGKSGTINDEDGARVDWFVAYAKPSQDGETAGPLALAAVVVHDGRTATVSQEMVRRAALAWYGPRLSEPKSGARSGATAARGKEAQATRPGRRS
ncbi:MAG: hypothetical protein LBU12_03930 [Deltaproteobacteria bacterium]|jgi:cell division protein FtsI/penicillin-binding protein 2|nr:hypothetical protein [Deltaproteobacteria bacterium]